MKTVIKSRKPYESGEVFTVAVTDDDGAELSTGIFFLTNTSFGMGWIKTLLVCGLSTPVQNRRQGSIRLMITDMQKLAADEGAAVALLHPFSFSYYSQFGYERVADHLIAEFDIKDIDFVPRRCNFVPYGPSRLPDMIKIYDKFSKGRNLLMPRFDESKYTGGGKQAYIYYDGGEPAAYIVATGEKTLFVNNYINTRQNVNELAYTSPEALKEVFSFLRMFEGEYDRVRMFDLSLCFEADLMLKHYAKVDYKILPDISARVLNTEKLLSAADYPQKEGAFTVCVKDGLDTVNGVFRVEYGGGKGKITKLDGGREADITLTAGSLAQIAYGYRQLDGRSASYLDGVRVNGDCEDFFRAFPKRPCGAFEHF